MEVSFALLADAANVSREGKLNVLGAFDRIYGSKFPLTWPRMVLVTRFVASAAEVGGATGKIRVPQGQAGRQLKINHVLPMSMTFPAPGGYSIEILVNGESKATVPLEVVQREEKVNGQAEGGQQQ